MGRKGRGGASSSASASVSAAAVAAAAAELDAADQSRSSHSSNPSSDDLQVEQAALGAKAELEEAKKRVREAEEEVNEAKKRVKEAEKKVNEADEEVREAKKKVREAEKKVKEADAEKLKECKDSYDRAFAYWNSVKADLRDARAVVQSAIDGVNTLKGDVQSAINGVQNARALLEKAEEKSSRADLDLALHRYERGRSQQQLDFLRYCLTQFLNLCQNKETRSRYTAVVEALARVPPNAPDPAFANLVPSKFAAKEWKQMGAKFLRGRQSFHVGQLCRTFFEVENIARADVEPDDAAYGSLMNISFELASAMGKIYDLESSRVNALSLVLNKLAPEGCPFLSRSFSSVSSSSADGTAEKSKSGGASGSSADEKTTNAVSDLSLMLGDDNGHMVVHVEVKNDLGPSKTEPVIQNFAYYMRHGAEPSKRHPALLLTVAGSYAVLSGAAWFNGKPAIQNLCVLDFDGPNYPPIVRFVNALMHGIRALVERHRAGRLCSELPDYCVPRHVGELRSFCPMDVERRPYLYMADLKPRDGDTIRVVVKFCSDGYGVEAHNALTAADLAPRLVHAEKLGEQWWVVVVELVDESQRWSREHANDGGLVKQLKRVMTTLRNGDHVHGDLRPPNVLVRGGQVFVIDFDWAASRRYPHNRNHRDVLWPTGSKPGDPITHEDDEYMIEQLLRLK